MRARELGLLIIIASFIGATVFSASQTVNVSASPNANGTTLDSDGSRSTNTPREAVVVAHGITANELKEIKEKVGVSVKGANYNRIIDGHGTGLRAPTSDEWQEISQTGQIAERVVYGASPNSVDNSELAWFPPIGNQGTEGSCVAWSVGYYIKTFQEAKEHTWNLSGALWVGTNPGSPSTGFQNRIMSPEFLYHLINFGVDDGASFQDAVNLTCSIGISSWQKMPYSQTNHSNWPSEQAWTEAPYYRGGGSGIQYLDVDTASGIENLKSWLAAGNLAAIGVDADFYGSALSSNDVWTLDNYRPTGASSINHANTVVGYDANITYTESGATHQGAFKVANSWGKGGWEHVPDGFLWISYEAMRQRVGATTYAMFFTDLIGYQPELLATFSVNHTIRGDCQITVGAGSPSSPITTKSFTQYISGGNFPFPANNMVMDITEFKYRLSRLWNQSYYLRVRDLGSPSGSSTVGTVTSFSIAEVSSSDAPRSTVNNNYVYLTLYYYILTSEVTLSPISGPAGTPLTLNGLVFTPGRSVNISYLNPVTSRWVSVVNNTPTNAQGQFTYPLLAPDLMQSSLADDHPETYDLIVFRATDNGNGVSCDSSVPFSEYRRGISRVGNATAAGVYGNGTNLTSAVAVSSGQTLRIEGKWFSPGNVTALWDGIINIGTVSVNQTGSFAANVTMPVTVAGRHEIVLRNGNFDFHVSVARLPSTTDDYDGVWHNADFTVKLTSDANNSEIYYRLNGGPVRNVAADGQPRITIERENNVLEYWSVDEFGNEESPHNTLTGVKLDKTAPSGSLQVVNAANYTNFADVSLNLTAADALSGVDKVRLSNDGVWDIEPWETPSSLRNWTLTSGDGNKTVYYQIRDNAGLVSPTYSCAITLDTVPPQGSILINDGSVYSNSTFVNLALSASDDGSGLYQMRFSNDNLTWSGWEQQTSSKPWALPGGDGSKIVYYQVKDASGLVSVVYSDEIVLDTSPPTGSIEVNSGANYSSSSVVSLTLTAEDSTSGIRQVRFSNDGVWDTESWETYSPIRSWTLALGDGSKTVYYQIMDNAGLTAQYSASVLLDTTKPSVRVGSTTTVTVGAEATFAAAQCEDNLAIYSTVWNFGDGATGNGSTTTHTYSKAGIYTVTLTVQDFAGNTATDSATVTAQNKVSGTIPEFSPFLLLSLLAAVTFLAVLMKRKSFTKTKNQKTRS